MLFLAEGLLANLAFIRPDVVMDHFLVVVPVGSILENFAASFASRLLPFSLVNFPSMLEKHSGRRVRLEANFTGVFAPQVDSLFVDLPLERSSEPLLAMPARIRKLVQMQCFDVRNQ